ncbi:Conserved_hypothetical protein [Hexamita inflata]|uniref:Uncharacterized protein n=1 Tax=Hexamita inflata TaxID=28002 RepID=A0ABP1IK11_9EUKA
MNGYHRWTKKEEDIFREAIVQFKYNWVRIQQNLLPHISVKSMKNNIIKECITIQLQSLVQQFLTKRYIN